MQTISGEVKIRPRMSPGDLEKVLKHLPEPTYVEVSLYGDFDYSSISHQAKELIPGAELQTEGGLIFRLKESSKERILDIYKKSWEFHRKSDKSKHPKEPEAIREAEMLYKERRVNLCKAYWLDKDKDVQTELTPWGVNVKYLLHGLEPDYISKMRQELDGTKVNLEIRISK